MTNDIPPPEKMNRREMDTLLAIMARLRDPERGCPWDVKQDFSTIAPYTIEEAYEVADAIARGDMEHLREELGDLLLQVVFHARMAEEQGLFAFADVVEAINNKMIFRHPHVFGEAHERGKLEDGFWDKAKDAEKAAKGKAEGSALDDIPLALPALTRAGKLQKRAARSGFDWPDVSGVVDKVAEEARELSRAVKDSDKDAMEDELGDLLFSLVNLARHLKLDPEKALRRANGKFSRRFRHAEEAARQEGKELGQLSPGGLDALWNAAKARE
jgi:MazG family protein